MEKYAKLVKKLRDKEGVVVSFSGGKDSTLVAKACIDAGVRCWAVTILSPLMAKRWAEEAKKIASHLGIKHFFIEKELDEKILRNDGRRCYYCKKKDAILLKNFADRVGATVIADGINADDEYLGKIAGDEEGIWHPLAEAGISRADVMKILKEFGIPVWNKPPQSCLATRIPCGERITYEKLREVEVGEEILLEYVDLVRLRHHGKVAVIETYADKLETLRKNEIIQKIKKIGFEKVVFKKY